MGKEDRYNVDQGGDTLDPDEPSPSHESDETDESEVTESSPTRAEIPHRVRHESPKDNRSQLTLYLADRDFDQIHSFKARAEQTFDETVHTLDVYLAWARCDGSESSFLEEMRAIGYGYFE